MIRLTGSYWWLWSLAFLVIVALVAGTIGYHREHDRIARELMENLELNHELTVSSVTGDLIALKEEIQLLAKNELVKKFLSNAKANEIAFDAWANACTKHFGYYDLFIITSTGDVIYSVAKEEDLGTNLMDGAYAASGLGELYKKIDVTKGFSLTDYSVYEPSNNELAGFIGSPVYIDGRFAGVLAIQLPTSFVKLNIGVHIDQIEDYILTADYYFKRDGTFGSLASLKLPEMYGQPVAEGDSLVVFTPFNLQGLSWGIVSIAPPVVFATNLSWATVWYYIIIFILVALIVIVLAIYYLSKKEENLVYLNSDIVLVQNTWHQFNESQHAFGTDFYYRLKNKAGVDITRTEEEIDQLGKLIELKILSFVDVLNNETAVEHKLTELAKTFNQYKISRAQIKRAPILFIESFEDELGRKLPARARNAWNTILRSLARKTIQMMREEETKQVA